jgi:hypothetical protein
MKSQGVLLLVMGALALALMAAPAGAAGINIVVEDPGAWQTVTNSQIDGDGKPYWDGNSSDASGSANIGNWIFNSGVYASIPNNSGNSNNNPPPYDHSPGLTSAWYLGKGDLAGSAVTNFYFMDGAANITMELEWAGHRNVNEFGYYTVQDNNLNYYKVFSGSDSQGASTPSNFSHPTYFGFYIKYNNEYYHTQTKYNNPADQIQHFAVFRDPSVSNIFYIGIEDLGYGGDKDYQDMIIKFSWKEPGGGIVPLPGSVLLLGTGLVGLLAARGFRRTRKK